MAEVSYHIPALLKESINALNIKPEGVYADATFGGGGHSRAILAELGERGRLLGFDQDIDAYSNSPQDKRFTFVHSNFRHIRNFMRYHGIDRFDGIIADLGVSFHHFDEAERGFSFRNEAPLDMRMNRSSEVTAARILEEITREDLIKILKTYTDLKHPQKIADSIIEARCKKPLTTTTELSEAVTPGLNPKSLKKDLAQVFQALRIAVNDEMGALTHFLSSMPRILRKGGRLAVLTYHSVEDRIVKNYLRSGNTEGIVEKDFFGKPLTPWRPVGKNPIVPSEEEIARNPRARSAKLRVAEFVGISEDDKE